MTPVRRVQWLLGALALAVTIVLVVWLFKPPQRTLTMAVGPTGTAEYRFGERYRELLARDGVRLKLLATNGPLENLAQLQDPKAHVDLAFVEGGTTTSDSSPDLVSLGTVYYQPLWTFYRGRMPRPGEPWPPDLMVAVGPEGNNPRNLARRIMAEVGAAPDSSHMLIQDREANTGALTDGRAQVAFLEAPWDSRFVQQLLLTDSVHLAGYPRGEAFEALHPELVVLTLPRGIADLRRDLPPADVELIGSRVSLAARRTLHPTLQYLLLEAASEVHGGPGIFRKPGEFPAPEPGDLPLSRAAISFHKSGTPFLQRHLPFWLAVLLTQAGLLLLPLVGIAYPLVRGAPAIYGAIMRHRLGLLYGELKLLELSIAEGKSAEPDDLLAQLEKLDARARKLPTTGGYAQMVYTLRGHIQLIHARLQRNQVAGSR
jgi:hypothetical protein